MANPWPRRGRNPSRVEVASCEAIDLGWLDNTGLHSPTSGSGRVIAHSEPLPQRIPPSGKTNGSCGVRGTTVEPGER